MTINARSAMNRRILLPLTAIAAAVGLLLAGCTTTDPKPTHSTHKSPSPSPTPSVGDRAPAQDKVDPPKSPDEAKSAAVKTINLYLRYDFQLLAHPELGGDYLYNYVDGHAQTIANDSASAGVAKKNVAVGGPVVFTPNYGISTTSQSVGASTGTIYQDANASIVGCADATALKFRTNGAAPTPATSTSTSPAAFTVHWNEKDRVWLVTDVQDLTGQPGAPKC